MNQPNRPLTAEQQSLAVAHLATAEQRAYVIAWSVSVRTGQAFAQLKEDFRSLAFLVLSQVAGEYDAAVCDDFVTYFRWRLRRAVIDELRHARAKKRGAGKPVMTLRHAHGDTDDGAEAYSMRRYRQSVLRTREKQQATEEVARLLRRMKRDNRRLLWKVWRLRQKPAALAHAEGVSTEVMRKRITRAKNTMRGVA